MDRLLTKEELTEIFWNNFKYFLRKKNMSQKEFCAKTGMNEKTLSSMISRHACPDIYFLSLVRDVFKLTYAQILLGKEEMNNTVTLSYKEKIVLDIIRSAFPNEQEHILDMTAAMLVFMLHGSLTFLDQTRPCFEPLVFTDTGLAGPERQQFLFPFMEDFYKANEDLRPKEEEEDDDDNRWWEKYK